MIQYLVGYLRIAVIVWVEVFKWDNVGGAYSTGLLQIDPQCDGVAILLPHHETVSSCVRYDALGLLDRLVFVLLLNRQHGSDFDVFR